jgi:hypothetical protein
MFRAVRGPRESTVVLVGFPNERAVKDLNQFLDFLPGIGFFRVGVGGREAQGGALIMRQATWKTRGLRRRALEPRRTVPMASGLIFSSSEFIQCRQRFPVPQIYVEVHERGTSSGAQPKLTC